MTRATIIAALIRFARKIGRWILRKLLEIGGRYLCGYMAGKIDDFRRRLQRAKTESRKKRLRGRIRRWSAALKWLALNRINVEDDIVREADDAAGTIPMVAAAEREAA